ILCYCAVNCYALISGYVGVNSKHKYSNIAILWLRVLFYSVIICIIFKICLPDTVNTKNLFASFFPVLTNQYWYFSAYFLLFLIIPILNSALNNLSKKQLQVILISVVFINSIFMPFFQNVFLDTAFKLNSGYSTIWLMFLYLIGGYIKKYGFLEKLKKIWLFLIYISACLLTLLSKYLMPIITKKLLGSSKYQDMWISYISITIVVSSIALLLLFERIDFKSSFSKKIVTFFSPLAFSVYIIHMQPCFYDYFVKTKFKQIADLPLWQGVLLLFALAIGFFIAFSLIDTIRHYLFIGLKIKPRLESLENKIKQKIKD
nr:acyltransferase [Clostridiales bacterium]